MRFLEVYGVGGVDLKSRTLQCSNPSRSFPVCSHARVKEPQLLFPTRGEDETISPLYPIIQQLALAILQARTVQS